MYLLSLFKVKNPFNNRPNSGFTLIEVLIVTVAIGILSAIAIPTWLGFVNQQRTTSAQNTALTLLRDAQVNAKRERVRWQACFWDDGTQVFASVRRASDSNECQTTNGISLASGDSNAVTFTSTFAQNPPSYYRVQFKYDGSVNGRLGKITFTPRNTVNPKRCVIVSTLLGAMRSEKDSGCN